MKKILIISIITATIFLTACKTALSDSALQTAVSEAIMTSSADQDEEETVTNSEQELEDVKSQLNDAHMKLTEQAGKVADLQQELENIYPLLTPSSTPVPTDTPPPTVGPTITPEPTATEKGGLLYNQKYVVTKGGIPLYTFTDRNKAGAPIMVKTDPIKKINAGERIIVDWHIVIGDGGIQFYLVQQPGYSGLYVMVSDVTDYTGP
jgi:hypothetical protein